MTLTTAEIAKLLAGEVLGDATATLTGFATADVAKPGDLTFAESEEFFAAAENCAATAIITDARFASTKKILIRVANPRVAFAKAITIFFHERKLPAGVHPSAVVAKSAQIDPTAHIGPHCVVGERVKLGVNVVLQSGNSVGDDSVLGDEVNLFPNVTIYPRTQLCDIARQEPSIPECLFGFFRFAPVFHENVRPSDHNFTWRPTLDQAATFVCESNFDPGEWSANTTGESFSM